MSTVVALGSNAFYIRSRPSLAYNVTNIQWNTPTVYNNGTYNQLVSMVTVGSYYVGATNTGTVVAGTSLDAIGEGPSISGTNAWFTPTGMSTDGTVVLIVGMYRDPTTLQEVGAVFTNQENDALLYVDPATLLVTSVSSPDTISAYQGNQCIIYYPLWNVPTANSVLYSCRYVKIPLIYDTDPVPVWIVCGRKDSSHGGIWWSSDQVTWTELPLPLAFQDRTVFDVTVMEYTDTSPPTYRMYFSCWGVILNFEFLSATWNSSQELVTPYAQPDLFRIAQNNSNELVAVASGGIFRSADGVNWSRFSQPGYQFRGVAWLNDMWVVGSETLLQTNQLWTSTDGVTWTGNTVGVNVQDVTVVG